MRTRIKHEICGVKRELVPTTDGSHTVAIPEMQVTYHSHHGAIRESMHVFIGAGLQPALDTFPGELSILEMGWGTGLNGLLTFQYATALPNEIHYHSLEQYPLEPEIVAALNYCDQLQAPELQPAFEQMHGCAWNEEVKISERFFLQKIKTDLLSFQPVRRYHVIYFDAFAPTAQPELWTQEVFEKLFAALHPGGLLVTYCSKGVVRRAMQAAGFTVEKIPGPPGKREMVRAAKP
jgi:tRNA U34 5-methylaminomethyl-2-thiouridine-forming methyltransferase MnmC